LRSDYDAQRLVFPLRELRQHRRMLVMESQAGAVQTARDSVVVIPRRLPSFSSLAFLLPVVFLYWQLGGPSSLLTDPSTGVHVRTGDWILAHHAVPHHDLFSFSLGNKHWCDWEWLSDVIFSRLNRWHGLSAVAAFSLVLLCFTSLLTYHVARLAAGRISAFGVTCLVMATSIIHWLARPHIFTWLVVALFCRALQKAETQERGKCLLALPALMILWVNLHPGFVACLLVLCLYCGGSALEVFKNRDAKERLNAIRRVRCSGWALAACALAMLVNPYGLHLHQHIASYQLSSVTAHVAEWLPPDFRNPRLNWFEVFLPVASAAALWHGAKRRFRWCLVMVGFLHLALVSVRNVPLFAIVSAAPVAWAAEEWLSQGEWERLLRQAEVALGPRRSTLVNAFIYGLVCVALAGILWGKPIALGPVASLPVEAAKHLPAGRLFTTDRWADYLIYVQPQRKVFFDGRNDFYGPDFVKDYLTVMRAEPGWQRMMNRYALTLALVPTNSAIKAALSDSKDWKKVREDSVATVFLRKVPAVAISVPHLSLSR
jgi:hypothetical protein